MKPFTQEDLEILHAAMTSMVLDCHGVQDNLSEAEWKRAEELYEELDLHVNDSECKCVGVKCLQ